MYRNIPDDEDEPLYSNRSGRTYTAVFLTLASIAVFRTAVSPREISTETQNFVQDDQPEEALPIQEMLQVSNEYERKKSRPLGDGLYPLGASKLVQVQKETLLNLASGTNSRWEVRRKSDDSSLVYTQVEYTKSSTVIFPEVGNYIVRAFITGQVKNISHEFSVTAKVIRYELRTLSHDDRKTYFEALYVFYQVSQAEGVKLYGGKYLSLNYLVRQHLYGAASIECDHWHDGAGIVNHHVGITWEMENSLRMIDNSTAAHYWDYTMEFARQQPWYESAVFKSDWFGDNSPGNENHVVSEGKFRYTPVMEDARAFSSITNPYGLLRSPWNTNPMPYLMRHNKTVGGVAYQHFPTCGQFAAYLSSGSVTFSKIASALNGELHGPVHIMIGGHWGFEDHKAIWDRVHDHGYTTMSDFLLYSKFLWRQGFLRLPETCSIDTPHEECMPKCTELITENYTAAEILDLAGFDKTFTKYKKLKRVMEDMNVSRTDLLATLCHIGSPGEMFTSAAPQDPTFWPLHGNAERFIQYVRILAANGTISYNETWGYHHQDVPSDTHVVCDWDDVDSATTRPTCYEGACPGHKEDDILPFVKLFPSQKDKQYSNAEFYELVSPFNEDLPYAYDGLSTWYGCKDSSLKVAAGL